MSTEDSCDDKVLRGAMSVAKGAMQCALDRGTKPDVLINIAVEELQPTIDEEISFKKPSLGGKENENVKKPAISAGGAIKFGAGKQTLTPKRAASTEKAPQKKAKTTHTPAVDSDDEQMVTLSDPSE
ncbi:hypothetical protein V494_01861 [Pseudogymnoascus sp. VKM F-4513 (FW-928)]|nr:hypothetical protein V494_01861 [Pseudogymnoascus sp. VKM F-4513 (FW-928)]